MARGGLVAAVVHRLHVSLADRHERVCAVVMADGLPRVCALAAADTDNATAEATTRGTAVFCVCMVRSFAIIMTGV